MPCRNQIEPKEHQDRADYVQGDSHGLTYSKAACWMAASQTIHARNKISISLPGACRLALRGWVQRSPKCELAARRPEGTPTSLLSRVNGRLKH